jgi:hypothetical protein
LAGRCSMSRRKGQEGQRLPWSALSILLDLRNRTKHPNPIPERQRRMVDLLAEEEMEEVVHEHLYGG